MATIKLKGKCAQHSYFNLGVKMIYKMPPNILTCEKKKLKKVMSKALQDYNFAHDLLLATKSGQGTSENNRIYDKLKMRTRPEDYGWTSM